MKLHNPMDRTVLVRVDGEPTQLKAGETVEVDDGR